MRAFRKQTRAIWPQGGEGGGSAHEGSKEPGYGHKAEEQKVPVMQRKQDGSSERHFIMEAPLLVVLGTSGASARWATVRSPWVCCERQLLLRE